MHSARLARGTKHSSTAPATERIAGPDSNVDASAALSPEAARELRELCFAGDWACADGNLEGLAYVATRIAPQAPEPLHCKLVVLAEMCVEDPDHAVAAWLRLKEQLLGRLRRLPS